MKANKTMKINSEQQLNIMKKVERELQIELNMNFNRHRIHKNKKAYNRKKCQNIW